MSEYKYDLKYYFNIDKVKAENLIIRKGKEVHVIRYRYNINHFHTVKFITKLFVKHFSKDDETFYKMVINTGSAINMLQEETVCSRLVFKPNINHVKKIIYVDVEMQSYKNDEGYEEVDFKGDYTPDKDGIIYFPVNIKFKNKMIKELGREGYEEFMLSRLQNVTGC